VGVSALTAAAGGIQGASAQSPSDETVSTAVAERAKYGFGGGEAKVLSLLESGGHPDSELYGFPVSKAEADDLADRSRFAEQVSRETLPFVRSLPQFGGAWIDQKNGGSLVVVLTSASAETRAGIRSRMPEDTRGLRIETADDTFDDLARAVDDSSRVWDELAEGVTPFAFGTDEQHNRVVARVDPSELESARQSIPRIEEALGVDVAVEGRDRPVDKNTWSACGGRHHCYGPFKLGVKMRYTLTAWNNPDTTYVCSMGFHVTHPTNSTLNRSFLTAGHCVYNRPGDWHHSDPYQDAYGPIGSRVSSRYNATDKRDIALVNIEAWAKNRSKSVYGETATRTMTTPDTPIENETLCMSLGNQDKVWCGTADHRHQKWESTTANPNIWVWGSGVNLCCGRSSIGGDSGSPIYRRWMLPISPYIEYITPVGILDAGNETPDFQFDNDIYFARVYWATNDPDGWPGLEIFDGPNGVGGPP